MYSIRQMINIVMDNRIVNKLVILVSTINVISSFFLIMKQHRILKEVINENDEFFTALGLMGFEEGKFFNLVSIHDVDANLTDEQIYSIANKNIIASVKNFIENEMLLGVIKIEVDKLKDQRIKFSINTAAYRLLLADLFDWCISALVTLIILSLLYFIF